MRKDHTQALAIGEFTETEMKIIEVEVEARKAKLHYRIKIPFNFLKKRQGYLIFSKKFYLEHKTNIDFFAKHLWPRWTFVVLTDSESISLGRNIYDAYLCEAFNALVGPHARQFLAN